MGLFTDLKATVSAMRAGVADAMAQPEIAYPIPALLNPTPQEEIDRLNAVGGPARGVLTKATHQPLEAGENVGRMKVNVWVHARLAAGELGPETKVAAHLSSRLAAKLRMGQEVPIEFDRATGVATAVDSKRLADELG